MFFNKFHVVALALLVASASTQAKGSDSTPVFPLTVKPCFVQLPTKDPVFVNSHALTTVDYHRERVSFYTTNTWYYVEVKSPTEADNLIADFLAYVENKCK